MNYTDTQLKQALAKMLPPHIAAENQYGQGDILRWLTGDRTYQPVLDTELLHLCWLVEETLPYPSDEQVQYLSELGQLTNWSSWFQTHATWQQRTIVLAKIKNIEIK